MQSQPEIQGTSVAPPISMQEKLVMQKQHKPATSSAPKTLVVSANSVTIGIPVSLSVSVSGSDGKSHHSGVFTSSNISPDLIIVNSHTGTVVHKESHPHPSHTVDENVYRLSELVMKEKDVLFKQEDSDSIHALEPHREGVQAVRMKNISIFTVLEESDEESDGRTHPVDQKKPKTPPANFPMYTPVFSLGQNLHHIFHQAGKHKRLNRTVAYVDASGESMAEDEKAQIPMQSGQSEIESDPEQLGHWYEKINMTPGMRRNKSQPNLRRNSKGELPEYQLENMTSSQSVPTTPGGSPKLKRRNSYTNLTIESVKPERLKPESTGPGLSFLASVAGELQTYKKRSKASGNPNPQSQVAERKSDNLDIERSRSSTAQIPNRPSSTSSVESSPGTSPQRPNSKAEMKASALHNAGQKKKSFFKSVMDWSTSKKHIGNKEANMYSPSSF